MYNALRKDINQLNKDIEHLQTDRARSRLLDFFSKAAPRMVDAESCSIFVTAYERPDDWVRTGTALDEDFIDNDRVSSLLVGETIRTGEPIYRNDLDEGSNDIVDVANVITPRDVVCIPLRSSDGLEITGAIQIVNRLNNGEPYSSEDLSLLEELASLLEISLENIYLFDEASGLVNRTWQTLTRVTIASVAVFAAALVAFSLYWFGFYLVGGMV